ncbi:MAG: hypothetical protein FJ207_10305 [Gemmatimonadetes bacterium]|nr:hypothetical protein [Gemmatimonadota bacterium]
MTLHPRISWRGRTLNAVLLLLQFALVAGGPLAHARHQGEVDPIRVHLHAQDGDKNCPRPHASDCQLCRHAAAPRLAVGALRVPTACATSAVLPVAADVTSAPSLVSSSPLGSRAPPVA